MGKTRKPTCAACGRPMVKVVSWKKYCSAKCRLVAWAKRQAGEHPDA